MENLIKKIEKAKQETPLSADTKRAGRVKLSHFMEMSESVRVATAGRHSNKSILLTRLTKPMPIILVLALLLSGGATVAAQHAEPGDFLYPAKVGFIEEAHAKLSFSTEGKAQWEAHRAEERLEEAGELEAQGRLTAENRADIQERFDRHVSRVRELIEELRAKGNTQAALAVEAALEASIQRHLDLKVTVDADAEAEHGNEARKAAKELRDKVRDSLKGLGELKMKLEVEGDAQGDEDKTEVDGDNDDINDADDVDNDEDVDNESSSVKVEGQSKMNVNHKGNSGFASDSEAEVEIDL